jgi:hypothetical protein
MNVSAIIVTRGNVDLLPVILSLPEEWEILVYNNGAGELTKFYLGEPENVVTIRSLPDMSVYGRYAGIEYASHDLIYVQDDDVIVSDPEAIVRAWGDLATCNGPRDCVGTDRGCEHCHPGIQGSHLVANMPQEFRHDGYTDSCLVGFGACFHRDLPAQAFRRYLDGTPFPEVDQNLGGKEREIFLRTCDVVFTTLTPRVLVDVPKTNREFAEDPDRMYRQPEHVGERARMLDLARQVRDA